MNGFLTSVHQIDEWQWQDLDHKSLERGVNPFLDKNATIFEDALPHSEVVTSKRKTFYCSKTHKKVELNVREP